MEIEESQLAFLLSLLQEVCIPDLGVDRRMWERMVNGSFSVASFCLSLQGAAPASLPYESIWKIKAPPRVMAFAWLAISGCILSMH